MWWALIKPWNNKIFKTGKTKKGLIREASGFQFNRKQIKGFKDGSKVKVKYQKTYNKWVKEEGSRYPVNKEITETSYRTYILKKISVK